MVHSVKNRPVLMATLALTKVLALAWAVPVQPGSLAGSVRRVGTGLQRALNSHAPNPPSNLLISPLSLQLALTILHLGTAPSNTQRQIAK